APASCGEGGRRQRSVRPGHRPARRAQPAGPTIESPPGSSGKVRRMPHQDPAKIRNVTVLGHRGTGKTSLVEAMLYAAGAVNRMGSVTDGSTVADYDEDEKRRGMSIAASLCHLTWKGVQVNLIDTPGEQSFHADTLSSLRAADAALMVVNGTIGVEVQTERLWSRC